MPTLTTVNALGAGEASKDAAWWAAMVPLPLRPGPESPGTEGQGVEGGDSPLHRMARLRPRASAVPELMFSTSRCFTFFNTGTR